MTNEIKVIDMDCCDGFLISINGGEPSWRFGEGVKQIASNEFFGESDFLLLVPQRFADIFVNRGLDIKVYFDD